MENIMIVATIEMSAGNESVGEMWEETKIFSIKSSLEEVMVWANETKNRSFTIPSMKDFRGNLTLTIGH